MSRGFEYAVALFGALVMLVLFTNAANAYSIQGDTVYEENGYFYISQTPHTLHDIQNFVVLNFTNKGSQTRDIDVAFGFDTTIIKPVAAWLWKDNVAHNVTTYGYVSHEYVCALAFNYTSNPKHFWCYYAGNGTSIFDSDFTSGNASNKTAYYNVWGVNGSRIDYYADYVDVSNKFSKTNWNGKTWYYVRDTEFAPYETKLLKIQVNVKPNTQGKYDLFAKLSSDGFQEAWDSGRYILMDPWWSATFTGANNYTWTAPYNTINNTVYANFTDLDLAGGDCSALRVVQEHAFLLDAQVWNTGNTAAAGSQYCTAIFGVNETAGLNTISAYFGNTSGVTALNQTFFNFHTSFEDYVSGWTEVEAGTATLTRNLTSPYAVYSLNATNASVTFYEAAGADYAYARKALTFPATWNMTGMVYLQNCASVGGVYTFIASGVEWASGHNYGFSVKNDGAGNCVGSIHEYDGGYSYVDSSVVLALNTWYGFRLERMSATNVTLFINETFAASKTVTDQPLDHVVIADFSAGRNGRFHLDDLDVSYLWNKKYNAQPYLVFTASVAATALITTITTPINATVYGGSSLTTLFSFTSDTHATANCTRYLNGTIVASTIVANATNTSDALAGLVIDNYYYSVNCTSGADESNASAHFSINNRFKIFAFDEATGSRIWFTASLVNNSNTTAFTNVYYVNESSPTLPHGLNTITISNASYYPRSYFTTITASSDSTLNTYLLNASTPTAIFVRFHIQTASYAPVANALVNISKYIGGFLVVVGSAVTDSFGLASFYMDSTTTYYVSVTSTVGSASVSLMPVLNDYTIILGGGGTYVFPASCYDNTSFSFTPVNHYLFLGNNYVNTTLFASDAGLLYWGWLFYVNGTLVNTSNYSTTSGGALSFMLNYTSVNASSNASLHFFWDRVNVTQCDDYELFFVYNNTGYANYSLIDAMRSIKASTALPSFGFELLVLLFTAVIIAFAARYTAVGGAIIGIIVLNMFAIGNWISWPMALLLDIVALMAAYFIYSRGY